MKICQGCGGILGIDCFNEPECIYICQQQDQQQYKSDDYNIGYREGEQFGNHMQNEFAKGFAEWTSLNDWHFFTNKQQWGKLPTAMRTFCTSSELLQKYKESL